jgi:hypothetical protein
MTDNRRRSRFISSAALVNAAPVPSIHHLCQEELARRWRISPRTLERWRWLGEGPAFLKIGGRVAYRLLDVEAYETAQRRTPAPTPDPFFQKVR